jgi:hypothetical protein
MWRCPKHFPEHLLPSLGYWKDPLKLSELAEAINIASMQKNDGRALTLIVISDPESIKGCEGMHLCCPSWSEREESFFARERSHLVRLVTPFGSAALAQKNGCWLPVLKGRGAGSWNSQ